MLVVVVVVDGHADVVQQRRGPQQLALGRVAGVHAGRGSASQISSASRATCSACGEVGVVLRGEVAHGRRGGRRRTAAGRRSRRSKKTPSRRPASVASSASKPPASITAAITSAPARIRSARAGLMPGTSPRSAAGRSAKLLDQLVERVARDAVALDAERRQPGGELRRGREVAHRAADRRPAARRRPATAPTRALPRRARAAP